MLPLIGFNVMLQTSLVLVAIAQGGLKAQCRDPLFQTHWSGKNDIQTLTVFPTVKTNLKLCPAFNQRASCCHQTFESEQQKYYKFWLAILQSKFARADAHRQSLAAMASEASNVDVTAREQLALALQRYARVLNPQRAQSQCLSTVLTYIAGAICFACKPEWFRYAVVVGDTLSGERVVRLRMASTVCIEVWDSCARFGQNTASLLTALQDSSIARTSPLPEEDLNMFTNQQSLCDWLHAQVALHPFKLPTKEDGDVPVVVAPVPVGTSQAARSLAVIETLDILSEGRMSGFRRVWLSKLAVTSDQSLCRLCAMPAFVAILSGFVVIGFG